MITAWTHHLSDPAEKDQFEKSLRNSKWILDRLNEMLVDMDKSLDRQETSPASYDTPSWAYKQAHLNGYRSCLSKVQQLINLDLKEQNDRKSTGKRGRPTATRSE